MCHLHILKTVWVSGSETKPAPLEALFLVQQVLCAFYAFLINDYYLESTPEMHHPIVLGVESRY